jgi:ribosome small subunit-dependent GTPase A
MIKGRVTEGVASGYVVDIEGSLKRCTARGRLKLTGEILVGDFVEVEETERGLVIVGVLPRRNFLVRPYVANIDVCFIVIASVPAPDFVLVDKLIINCKSQGITPVLVVNKEDLSDAAFKVAVESDYQKVVETVICCAISGDGIGRLLEISSGKVACFAGQSAVGKSSILNALLGEDVMETGGLSAKIDRGKNTTRRSLIVKIEDGNFIDTCGFSMLELLENPDPENFWTATTSIFHMRKNANFAAVVNTETSPIARSRTPSHAASFRRTDTKGIFKYTTN